MLQSPRRKTSDTGRLAEEYAAGILSQKGYKIIERNFRSRFGEIDIIALDGETLVFVEVKARWSRKFGDPAEAVTPKKIEKIKRTGEYFSILNPALPKKLRIDVVALEMEGPQVTLSRIIKVF